MTSASDSFVQRSAERLILDAVSVSLGVPLSPKRITLGTGAVADVDGVAPDESVLVEVFAHMGPLKGGQRHKIAGDALKLITIARGEDPAPRLVLAFADQAMTGFLSGKSWLAAAIAAWDIKVMIASLDDSVLAGIRAAQARQVMINPPSVT